MVGTVHRHTLGTPYGRYGCCRIAVLLRRNGWRVNVKRVYRIWRREELKVPAKQPKRGWLTAAQLAQRRAVVKERTQQREENKTVTRSLTEDAKVFQNMEADADSERDARREALKEQRRAQAKERPRRRSRDGPELDR